MCRYARPLIGLSELLYEWTEIDEFLMRGDIIKLSSMSGVNYQFATP